MENMKQFNLKEYLENPKRKIVTRDGRHARVVYTNVKNKYYPIVSLVEDSQGIERVSTVNPNGQAFSGMDSPLDLFFKPIKRIGWINMYKSDITGKTYSTGTIYTSKDNAIENKLDSLYIGSIEIEWEE